MSAVGSILTNTGALNALNSISNTATNNSMLENQLSSGLSINSPSDNPAGYVMAQGLTSQLNGVTQAISNANQGVSLLQTAQGAIGQQVGIVQQLNSISVQAANGTQTSQELQSLQNVVGQLTGQVSTIANQTQFNNINLLNGSFKNVQLQVGANEGQTMSLSIGNTASSALGMNASTVNFGSATTYNTKVNASSASGAVTTGAGAFAAKTVSWTGNNGNTGSTNVTKTESAATIAAAVNATTATTGVQAQANTQVTLNATAGAAGFAFTLQGSGATTQTINAQNTTALVSQINGGTATTGITASLNSTGQVVLNQSNGQNIAITGVTAGSLKTTGGSAVATGMNGVTNSALTVQGQVQFQSGAGFSLGNGSAIGENANSTLSSLANVNVTTTAGANKAINVVKFALQSLSNQGAQLGATQQALTANLNNLNTTSQNATQALGVVQDANIPQVSNQLTQAQIQAQAGVAALKSSTTLQQSYLSLLP